MDLQSKVNELKSKFDQLPEGWQQAIQGALGVGKVDQIVGGVGAKNCHEAHCVRESTYIEMSDGLLRIKDVVPDMQDGGYEDVSSKAVSDRGLEDVVQLYHHGLTSTIKITDERGFSLEATPNHRIKDEYGSWIRLDELKVGDRVRIQLGTVWPIEDPLIPNTFLSSHHQDRILDLPTRLTPLWAEVLGLWTSEGCYNHSDKCKTVRWMCNLGEKDYFYSKLTSLGLTPIFSQNKDNPEKCEWAVNSKHLYHWFTTDLKLASGAHNKHVPDVVLRGTWEINKAYISGLIQGDGSQNIKGGQVYYNTVSPILAEEVQQLWRRLGIPANRFCYKFARNEKTLSKEALSRKLSGGVLTEKEMVTTKYEVATFKRWTPLIAEWIQIQPDKVQKMLFPLGGKKYHTEEELTYSQSHYRLQNWSYDAYLDGRICGVLLTKIKDIKVSSSVVKDLVIPSNNTYITAGFVSHQTQGRWRERSLEQIKLAAEQAVRKQGADSISFYCQLGSTLVLTSNGIKRLDELEEINLSGEKILTEYGPKAYLGCTTHGEKPVYRVRTHTGSNVYTTDNHRLRVLNKDGVLEWVEVSDLQEGDYLLQQKGDGGILPDDKGEEPDFWYSVGHLIGDGSRQPDPWNGGEKLTWLAPLGEEESLERVKKFLKARGLQIWESRQKATFSEERHGTTDMLVVMTKCREMTAILGSFAQRGNWRNRGLPKHVFHEGKAQISALLKGLFTTDGGMHESIRQISFTSKRRQIVQDVKFLCSILGVVTTIHSSVQRTEWGINRKYQLYVTGEESRRLFAEKIGFELTRKSDALERVVNHDSSREKTGIPNLKNLLTKIFPYGTSFKGVDSKLQRIIYGLRKGSMGLLTKSKAGDLLKVAERLGRDKVAFALLQEYVMNDWWFDKVKKVERWYGERKVYDPVNTETHSYVGNGLVSHQSLTWSLHSRIYSLLLWSYERFGSTNLISQRADQSSADPEFFKYQNRQGENHCVAATTLINTDHGFLPIETLSPEKHKVLTRSGYRNFTKVLHQGVRDVVKLCTNSGTHLVCTPNHKVQRVTESGIRVWTELSALRLGDEITTCYSGSWTTATVTSITEVGSEQVYDLANVEAEEAYLAHGIYSHNCTLGVETCISASTLIRTKQGLKEVRALQVGEEVFSPSLRSNLNPLGEALFTNLLQPKKLQVARRRFSDKVLNSEEFLLFFLSAVTYNQAAGRRVMLKVTNDYQLQMFSRLGKELGVRFYKQKNGPWMLNSKELAEIVRELQDPNILYQISQNILNNPRWSLCLLAALYNESLREERDGWQRVTSGYLTSDVLLIDREDLLRLFGKASLRNGGVWVTLSERDRIKRSLSALEVHVSSQGSYSKISKVVWEGPRRILRVTLNTGRSLELTEDHRIFTESGWVDARHLKVGDALQIDENPVSYVPTALVDDSSLVNVIDTIPFAEFWGYLTADGFIDWGKEDFCVDIFDGDLDLLTYWREFWQGMGRSVRIENRPQHRVVRLKISAPGEISKLSGLGLKDCEIPVALLTAPLAYQAAFLRGFVEGDGGLEARENKSGSNASVSISQSLEGKNPLMIHRLVEMFEIQKIPVSFNKKEQTSSKRQEPAFTYTTVKGIYREYFSYPWLGELDVVAAGYDTFKEKVGFLSKRKRDTLLLMGSSDRLQSGPNRVHSIELLDKMEVCYDIQLEGDPWFYANGIVVHNCSQRMRNYFNKSLSTDQLIRSLHNAAWAGYSNAKLFMILSGLETTDDIQEFCDLLRQLRRDFLDIAKQRTRQLGKDCNPMRLAPSFMLLLGAPHTALQWSPCSSSFDLKNNGLKPVVEATRECGFGFRTALTRDKVRFSQLRTMMGRESTQMMVESALRTRYVDFGPVSEEVVWCIHNLMKRVSNAEANPNNPTVPYDWGTLSEPSGYDWIYHFREKPWDHIFPSDAVATPMDRDYLWNAWLRARAYVGLSYCNPAGSLVTMADARFKPIEDVRADDLVYTHKGQLKKVLHTMERFIKEPLLEVYTRGSLKPLRITKEHPVMLCRSSVLDQRQDNVQTSLELDKFSWVPVSSAKVGDVLHRPSIYEQSRDLQWGGNISAEIERIDEVSFEGRVYHLEVEDHHSYLVDGISCHNCLKTSVNPNPKCSSCGACGTPEDRKFMLTRPIESSEKLIGQEGSRRDMTVRKKVRWDVEITNPTKRVCLKDMVARELVRAMMLSASEDPPRGLGFHNDVVHAYLRVSDHSLKHAEGMNNQPWVGGHVYIDTVFNKNYSDDQLRKILPMMNELVWGMTVHDFVASDKLVPLDNKCFALYTVDLPIPLGDLQSSLEKFDESESIRYKQKVNIAKDVMRTEFTVRVRSDIVPMALLQPTSRPGYNRLTFLCTLTANPMQILITLTGRPPRQIRPSPISCLGIYQPQESAEDDIFAILEDRSVICQVTDQPIELDVFTGERYRSKSAPNLCLAADLKGVMQMRDQGVNLSAHAMRRR